ncbi:MAG TPA: preprotein translocase subunit SecA [Candidatus Dormibacteraeota bacterium]|nr:preprotein translocase subunit SecA [Candidatus Dormibacteraeota bacterium]
MSVLTKVLGDPNAREVKRHLERVADVNELESLLQKLSDDELKAKTAEFRQQLADGHTIEDILEEAFAVVREAARRTIGLRPFDVQMVGGIVLHQGKIAEMKTGEGKTLVAVLPLYLNALEAKGVHLVTVNDYLARRDAGWNAPIYHALGMTVAVIGHEMSLIYDPEFLDETHPDPRLQHLRPISRPEAYQADITYGTNSEFGFDYLRDNMAVDLSQCVQRGLHYAIVDEVDSILIDEARTPLIISGQAQESTEKYYQYARLISRLAAEDFTVDEKTKSASLTEEGIAKIERWTGIKNVYELEHVDEAHQINQALKAATLYKRDRDYLVKDGEVIIVDEFTGRQQPGRRWADGLHQAVEAKEGVKVQQETQTLATITYQNYFRLYKKLAGMTGTAVTEAEEFDKIYKLQVVVIPTHKPMVREDNPDLIYKTEDAKFNAVAAEIQETASQGRPVLVGTVSVEKSERLSRILQKRGVPHEVLNAKQHEREALIVAKAGQPGSVTIATNMAGRGTDIVLGEGVAPAGGLHIVGTERHESRRIDNQLRGRAGRQGDPGSSRFFLALDDDLMRIFGGERIKGMMNMLRVADDEPIESRLVSRQIEGAQTKVEGHNFDARRYLVEYDDVMNKQREIIYAERRKVLEGADLRPQIREWIEKVVEDAVNQHCESRHPDNWDLEGLVAQLGNVFPLPPFDQLSIDEFGEAKEAVVARLMEYADAAYKTKEAEITEPMMRKVEQFVVLKTIDSKWISYLTMMEHFKEGIGLRAFGQKDPLIEYKNEAFQAFQELTNDIQFDIASTIYRVQLVKEPPQAPPPLAMANQAPQASPPGAAARPGKPSPNGQPAGPPNTAKLGRNDPCWCGSGKKYKKCHGR